MAGGTQLVEGAFLTGGNTRFCRKSSKCRNYAPFEGDVIKYVLRIILGFGSNEPPSKKESDSNVPLQFFWIYKSNYLDLRTFVAITLFLGGTLGQNLVVGAQKHFNGPGLLFFTDGEMMSFHQHPLFMLRLRYL